MSHAIVVAAGLWAAQQARPTVAEAFDVQQWRAWFSSLEPSFVFLLTLPFLVAAAGLLADYFRSRARRP